MRRRVRRGGEGEEEEGGDCWEKMRPEERRAVFGGLGVRGWEKEEGMV